MAWRFVEQPNGRLARFSEVVDHFTDYDLDEADAIDLCVYQYSLDRTTARRKVAMARSAGVARYTEALDIIKTQHGDDEHDEVMALLGQPKEALPL